MPTTSPHSCAALPRDVPVQVIGAASNLIVRDGGLPGVTIRLARGFSTIAVEPDGVIAGAAALDVTVAEHAAAAGLTGLEFLSGIPGTDRRRGRDERRRLWRRDRRTCSRLGRDA